MIDKALELLREELHLPDIQAFALHTDAPVETFSVKLSEMKGRADLPIMYRL